MSPASQSKASHIASKVENRMERAFPVLSKDKFVIEIPTFSDSSVNVIFRLTIIKSNSTSIIAASFS